MLFYSHLCLAKLMLEKGYVQCVQSSKQQSEYYLGAILPDIRYFSALPREQTHPPPLDFINMNYSEDLMPFRAGYLIHLIIDILEEQLQFNELVGRRFWFLPTNLRSKLSQQTVARVLAEFFYLRTTPPKFTISHSGNPATEQLGISNTHILIITTHIESFLRDTSMTNISTLLGHMGLTARPKIARYLSLANQLDNWPIAKAFLTWRVATVVRHFERTLAKDLEAYSEAFVKHTSL